MRRFGERAEGELAAALAPDDVALLEIRRPLLEKTSWHLVDGKAWMLANAMFILGGFGKAVIATLGASDLLRESVARSHHALQGDPTRVPRSQSINTIDDRFGLLTVNLGQSQQKWWAGWDSNP